MIILSNTIHNLSLTNCLPTFVLVLIAHLNLRSALWEAMYDKVLQNIREGACFLMML